MNEICECCDSQVISDDPKIAEQMLCDRCWDEINDEDFMGWKAGQ